MPRTYASLRKKILDLQDDQGRSYAVLAEQGREIERLRTLVIKSEEALFRALDGIYSEDAPGEFDWRAEASGLAYMICSIHDRYLVAKANFGGDSELLASSIESAEKYVNGPMLEHYNQSDGHGDT